MRYRVDPRPNKYAKQCVNQALLLQYCERLGKDGPALFIRRYYHYKPIDKALMDFTLERWPRIPWLSRCSRRVPRIPTTFSERVKDSKDYMITERETIQLVPAEEGQTITFDVPDGSPPAGCSSLMT